MRLNVAVGWCVFLLAWLGSICAYPKEVGRITSATVTPAKMVRLVLETAVSDPDALFLESADSLLGPWRKEPEVVRTPFGAGFEFLTPHRSYFPQRYYRFARLTMSSAAAQALPYIRFISPNEFIQPGQRVTLLGANFSPNAADNTVTFELANAAWNATVTEAATNYLMLRVPTNLVANANSGTVYRVFVKTSAGEGNGVGAEVQRAWPTEYDGYSDN